MEEGSTQWLYTDLFLYTRLKRGAPTASPARAQAGAAPQAPAAAEGRAAWRHPPPPEPFPG